MEQVKSSLYAGVVAALVLAAFLLVTGVVLQGYDLFAFSTFTTLCSLSGEAGCTSTLVDAALTFTVFMALFGFAWPLVFAALTWGLPGESGPLHGAVFALFLWAGYVAVVLLRLLGGQPLSEYILLLSGTFVSYMLYGIVLGSVYDRLAEHRTLLSENEGTLSEDFGVGGRRGQT
ncbi:DUF6789 family protein [Haloarchaeobius sp. DFWS5]|uniref:DUF6789 family protein n=1 Tax=Haloarchaeobius sp. DFWS5 TaxID=3446114 RepID=UPI003EBCFB21